MSYQCGWLLRAADNNCDCMDEGGIDTLCSRRGVEKAPQEQTKATTIYGRLDRPDIEEGGGATKVIGAGNCAVFRSGLPSRPAQQQRGQGFTAQSLSMKVRASGKEVRRGWRWFWWCKRKELRAEVEMSVYRTRLVG